MQPFKTALLASLLLFTSGSVAMAEKLSPEFALVHPSAMVDVIVHYHSAPTAEQHQKIINRGGTHKSTHDIIQSATYRVSAAQLAELANDPNVAYVSPDRPLEALAIVSAPVIASSMSASSIGLDYFRETAHADPANNPLYDGSGVVIAVIDSGITVNADFKKPLLYQQSFVPGDSSTADAYGHGTHVAGILVGSGRNSSGWNSKYQFGGAAPGASLVNLRVLDANGNGSDSSVISAIQRAIALKSTYNIRVISLSLGRPPAGSYLNDPLCQAVEAAWKAGIVVVVAAGNEGRNNSGGNLGYGTILAPANDPYVITVGAMKSMGTTSRNDDFIASYSSKGPTLVDHIVKPDLVAPGNLVISVEAPNSTLAKTFPANEVPTSLYLNPNPWMVSSFGGSPAHSYYVLSGTSMAAPVVSAAAATLIEKNPGLTPDQVKARLMKTASKSFPVTSSVFDAVSSASYVSYYDIFTVGAGYLDVSAALANNDLAAGSALSPSVTYNATTKTATLNVKGNGIIWGTNGIWGTGIIWGTEPFVGGTSIIWGSAVSWGTATPSGQGIIWGTIDGVAGVAGIAWGKVAPGAASLVRGE